MTPELLQGLAVGISGIVASVLVVKQWLGKTTAALDAMPQVQSGLEEATKAASEAVRLADAAHRRISETSALLSQEIKSHGERLARHDERWASHDREQERSDRANAERLGRIETKLDELLERGACQGGH